MLSRQVFTTWPRRRNTVLTQTNLFGLLNAICRRWRLGPGLTSVLRVTARDVFPSVVQTQVGNQDLKPGGAWRLLPGYLFITNETRSAPDCRGGEPANKPTSRLWTRCKHPHRGKSPCCWTTRCRLASTRSSATSGDSIMCHGVSTLACVRLRLPHIAGLQDRRGGFGKNLGDIPLPSLCRHNLCCAGFTHRSESLEPEATWHLS